MKLLKSFSIYTISTFIDKGIGFLLLPVFTYYLSPEDYGRLELIITLVAIVSPFILLQIRGAVSVEFFKLKPDFFQDYFKSALYFPFLSFLILSVFFILVSSKLAQWLDIPRYWIMLIPLLSIVKLFPDLLKVIYQIKERPLPYSLFSLFQSLGDLSFSLILVVIYLAGFQGRLGGLLLSGSLFSIGAVFLLYRQGLFNGHFNKNYQKDAFQFGYKLIPHVIGALVINASDRIFISKLVSNSELGIYSIGYKIGSIIMILELAASQAWTPFLYKQLKLNTTAAKRKIVLAGYGFGSFLLISLFFLVVLTPFLYQLNILEGNYAGGSKYVLWVGLGYVFLGFYKIFTGFIFFYKKTKILTVLSVVNVIVNLVLNYLLIVRYGAIGAAYATTISFFIFFVLIAYFGNKLCPLPWLSPLRLIQNNNNNEAT